MPQGNDSWPDLGHINFGRIFDDKIASNILYAYDGIKEGEKWIKKTRGYFMTKCPELKPILDYVEGMSALIFHGLVIQGPPGGRCVGAPTDRTWALYTETMGWALYTKAQGGGPCITRSSEFRLFSTFLGPHPLNIGPKNK